MNNPRLVCLKMFLLATSTLFVPSLYCQEINQEINTIAVKGVTFNQVIDHLSAIGYSVETLDSQYRIVKTKLAKFPFHNNSLNLSILVQVQDSVAVITGWFCLDVNDGHNGLPDSCNVVQAKYTFGPYKSAFLQVEKFAKSLKSEVIYSKSD